MLAGRQAPGLQAPVQLAPGRQAPVRLAPGRAAGHRARLVGQKFLELKRTVVYKSE